MAPLSKVQPKQDKTAKKVSPNRDIPIGEQLAAVKGRLADARKDLAGIDQEAHTVAGASTEEAEEYKSLRERLIQLYELQVRVLEQIQVLDAAVGKLRQQMTLWTGFAEPPPYLLELSSVISAKTGFSLELGPKANSETQFPRNRMVVSCLVLSYRSKFLLRTNNEWRDTL